MSEIDYHKLWNDLKVTLFEHSQKEFMQRDYDLMWLTGYNLSKDVLGLMERMENGVK